MTRTRLNRLCWASGTVLLCLLLAAPAAQADRDFNYVVKTIGNSLHAKRQHRLLFALVGFFVSIAHPYGVSAFKLALFENTGPTLRIANDNLSAQIRNALSNAWQPLVRTYSRRDHEADYIFARPEKHGRIKMIIVALEDNEATVLQLKVNPQKLMQSKNTNTTAMAPLSTIDSATLTAAFTSSPNGARRLRSRMCRVSVSGDRLLQLLQVPRSEDKLCAPRYPHP